MPAEMLESSWARDVQTEAVIDALLVFSTAADTRMYVHARNVGEWAARIAAKLPCAPSPAFMRRCGVLSEVDPAILERLPETRDVALAVRAFQEIRMAEDTIHGVARIAALIVCVAQEFDSLAFGAPDRRVSASDALRMLQRTASNETREVVRALALVLRAAPSQFTAIA